MSGCYDKGLRCLAKEVAKELGVAALMQEGVYAMVGGPNFESIAEARLLQGLGVDAVGKNCDSRSAGSLPKGLTHLSSGFSASTFATCVKSTGRE